MFNVTDKAQEELLAYFQDKEPSAIRVFLANGGWAGPRLSLALDEPKESDEVFDFEGGIKFLMDKDLLNSAQPVTVDISYMGFTVDSSLQLGGGGCSSGSCGSGGSCSC